VGKHKKTSTGASASAGSKAAIKTPKLPASAGRWGGFPVAGVNYTGYHDSAVVLVNHDCEAIYAASEERYTRFKRDGRFPAHALQCALARAPRVAAIGVAIHNPEQSPGEPDPFWHLERLKLPEVFPVTPMPFDPAPFRQAWGNVPIHYFDHHLCHAAAGYFLSGMPEALVITCDGGMQGCPWNAGAFIARQGEGIRLLHGRLQSHYVQLVRLYTDVTVLLGFRPNLHEGKITGLAGRGRENPACEAKLLELELAMNNAPAPLYFWVALHDRELPASLEVNGGAIRQYQQALEPFSREDVAHAVQRITERRILEYIRLARAETGLDRLILAGGLFANVKINLECKRLGFDETFVCPPMSDEGVALGAAALALAETDHRPAPTRAVKHLFLGEEPDAGALPGLLDGLNIVYEKPERLHWSIAKELADGKTVARVLGAMEYGPRALGHRSIFCQATDPSVNDWLNHKLRRSEFMPFAPIVRAERAPELFEELAGAEHTARFMTICLPCKPGFMKSCPAVVHVDNTARPQIVDLESAPDAWRILEQYESLTGLPALVNTSFNVHDEPIVHSYQDAIQAFFQSKLDVLAIEDRLVYRDRNAAFDRAMDLASHEEVGLERALRRRSLQVMGGMMESLAHYVEKLKEAKAYLSEEAEKKEKYIGELLEAKQYLEGDGKKKEKYIGELLEAKQYLEGEEKKKEKYIGELLEAKQYLEGEGKKKEKYIGELLEAKQYLEGEEKKKEKYIGELLEAKQYLENEGGKKDAQVQELIEAKNRLDDERARLNQRNDQLATEKDELAALKQEIESRLGELAVQKARLENELEQSRKGLLEANVILPASGIEQREGHVAQLPQDARRLDDALDERMLQASKLDVLQFRLGNLMQQKDFQISGLVECQNGLVRELLNKESRCVETSKAVEQLREELARRDAALRDQEKQQTALSWENEKKDRCLKELQEAKEYLEGEVQKKDTYIQELYDAKTYLDGELEKKEAYNQELIKAKECLEGEATKHAHAAQELAVAQEQAQAQMATLTETARQLEATVADKERQANELAAARDGLAEQLRQASGRMAELEGEIPKKDKYIQELYDAKTYLDGELAKKEAYNQELFKAKEYLEGEAAKHAHAAQELAAARDGVAEQLRQARGRMAELEGEIPKKDKYIQELHDAKTYLDGELEKKEAYNQELIKAKECLEGEATKHAHAAQELAGARDGVAEQLRQARGRMAELEGELQKSTETIAVLQNRQTTLEAELTQRVEQLAGLENKRDRQAEALQEKQRAIEELEGARRTLTEELGLKESSLSELRRAQDALEHELAAKDAHIAELSRSWLSRLRGKNKIG
jgi:carbamoyltransferase